MRKIYWNEPVETIEGHKVVVVAPGKVKGIPADPAAGRFMGKDMVWSYTLGGMSQVGFLPNVRNVGDV